MKGQKEWSITEDLPNSFVKWLKENVREKWLGENKELVQLASEIGVRPAEFSRWMGGKGPLTQKDIDLLADYFDKGIYILIGSKSSK